MRKLNFYQNEEKQKCIVDFGYKSIVLMKGVVSGKAKFVLEELKRKQICNENIKEIPIYSDRSIIFEFDTVESIETVIGCLGDLRNEFIKVKENECK